LKLLFVGRNPLRKGLHHLLLAWSQARRRPGDTLTVVCAERPQALTELAVSAGGVEWLPRVSTETLRKLYASYDALVVPSLCEGFGHVYLEAMSYGCPVVGTSHSMLADLDGVESGVFVVGVGDVESLSQLLTDASANRDVFGSRRSAAAAQPLRFTWEAFRTGLVQALRRLDAGLEDSAEHNDPADKARP
jgi:glycosyltransferase involved in cell wall biosynthesis